MNDERKRKVILVEDNDELARMLVTFLELEGFEIRAYTEGFSRLLSPGPWEGVDIALVDLWLQRDAFLPDFPYAVAILEYLKKNYPHIKRIIHSAADPLTTIEGITLDELADVILTKPTHLRTIVEVLNE